MQGTSQFENEEFFVIQLQLHGKHLLHFDTWVTELTRPSLIGIRFSGHFASASSNPFLRQVTGIPHSVSLVSEMRNQVFCASPVFI